MKTKSIFLCMIVAVAYMACGGGQQVKQEAPKQVAESTPSVQAAGFDADVWVKSSNEQLARVPFDGFAYKSSEIPSQKWDKWAVTAAPVISGVISKLPEGYVLQVTGHADGSGPEEAEAGKPGNIKISTDRARSVYNSLRKKGISSPKMTYKGVGSSQLISDADSRSGSQRRVTFNVVPK